MLPTPNDLYINRKIKDHFDSTEWTYKVVSEFGVTTCKPKEEFSIMSPEEVKQTGKDKHYFFASSIKKGKTLDDALNNVNRLFKNVISIDFKSKADIWKSAGPIPVKNKYKP